MSHYHTLLKTVCHVTGHELISVGYATEATLRYVVIKRYDVMAMSLLVANDTNSYNIAMAMGQIITGNNLNVSPASAVSSVSLSESESSSSSTSRAADC